MQIDFDLRMRRGEAAQHHRHMRIEQVIRRAEMDLARGGPRFHALPGLVVRGQQPPGIANELLARGRERHAAAVPVEERLPERLLEPLDLQ
jgi:hypothetical protein